MHHYKNSQSNTHTFSVSHKNCLIFVLLLNLSIPLVLANETTEKKPEAKMADVVGSYKFESDDGNFDAFLKAMDVSFVTRKVAGTTSPSIDISVKDDGTYVVSTTSTFKSSTIEFKLGEEFEEKRMDGATVRTTVTKEGNKLVQKQNANPPVEIVREFFDDKMITTCKCKDVVNVRTYKRVK